MTENDALEYIKNKKLRPAFSWCDVWNEEHASNFTVAKAMQVDVLSDIKKAVEQAIENGESFETFKKNLAPALQEKGWWGKKTMIDPVTGETVNAQLGSDRRLKTIYDMNTGQAYNQGRWQRTMDSPLHPYLMYRIGPSKNHRPDHQSWEGLILPKDDPWWDTHYPKNDWGCKCWTQAVSEARKKQLEESGIKVPPAVSGNPGYTARVKDQAPPTKYKIWVDERTGRIEKIPEGVSPGFAWNVGRTGRRVPNMDMVIRKTQDKVPEQYDAVMQSLMNNSIMKKEHYSFVETALKRGEDFISDDRNTTPVGFLDRKILDAVKANGKNLDYNSLITLNEGLVNSRKFAGRHTSQDNAPDKEDWYKLIDYLLDGDVYLDNNDLIYLVKKSESVFLKIVVNTDLTGKAHKGVMLMLPKISTMYKLDIGSDLDRGMTEYNRISRLKKIR